MGAHPPKSDCPVLIFTTPVQDAADTEGGIKQKSEVLDVYTITGASVVKMPIVL